MAELPSNTEDCCSFSFDISLEMLLLFNNFPEEQQQLIKDKLRAAAEVFIATGVDFNLMVSEQFASL